MEIEEQKAAAEESEGREAKMRLEAEQRLEQIKVIFFQIKVKAFFQRAIHKLQTQNDWYKN